MSAVSGMGLRTAVVRVVNLRAAVRGAMLGSIAGIILHGISRSLFIGTAFGAVLSGFLGDPFDRVIDKVLGPKGRAE